MLRTLLRSVLRVSPVLAIAIAGCGGDSVKLEPVAGQATFAGKPIVYGTIEFIPSVERNNKGPATSTNIVDGQYDTRKGGRGVVEGPHQVRITAYEEMPAPASTDETKPTESKPPLFIGYQVTVDGLMANHNFDVPESALGFGLTAPKPAAQPAGAP
jgi:hypothetical protein